MQEQSQGSAAAGAPRSITVLLQDDLADQAQVGGELMGSLQVCLAGRCVRQRCRRLSEMRPVCCAAVLESNPSIKLLAYAGATHSPTCMADPRRRS